MSFIKSILKDYYFSILVLLVILFSFLLRYFYAHRGLPYLWYWDEPQIASTALNMMKRGSPNPHFYNYGSFTIYSNIIVDFLHFLTLKGNPEYNLNHLSDVKTNMDTGWHWSISHPSFYLWNRFLNALFGTITVYASYLIGKLTFNKWVGIIGALFLGSLTLHIDFSAWITPDVPSAMFSILVVLFSILYLKYYKIKFLIFSLVFVGFGAATKYTMGLSIIVPGLAFLWSFFKSKKDVRYYVWFLIPLIPAIVFVFVMPFSILDFDNFLKDVRYEMNHYGVLGHAGAESVPGLEHLLFQLGKFYSNLGMISTIIVFAGFLAVIKKKLFQFALILPIVFILYITLRMKVNFHRNFILIYPFISLLFGAGLFYLFSTLNTLLDKGKVHFKHRNNLIAVLLISVFLIPKAYAALSESIHVYKFVDNRTKMIDDLNSIDNIDRIIIAEELRVHPLDLKKLKTPYRILPLLRINNTDINNLNKIYVLPQGLTSFDKTDKINIDSKQKFIINLKEKKQIIKEFEGMSTREKVYSKSPGILILRDTLI